MTEERCEPPPELRGVDGWHHVNVAGIDRPVWWTASAIIPPNADYMEFAPAWIAPGGGRVGPLVAYHRKWRYIAPVVTPADVDALRAERDAAIARDRNASAAHATRATDLWLVTEERDNLRAGTDRLIAERTTLRARVAELERAMVTILSWEPPPSAYDNWGPSAGYVRDAFKVARAAMEGKP